MEKKHILIGLGVLAVAGIIGISVYNNNKKKKAEKELANKNASVKIPLKKAALGTPIKKEMGAAATVVTEEKLGVIEEVKVKVVPVEMVPDRNWLERNWADVS